jgi:squalene-associated FAD-dependent desaturase
LRGNPGDSADVVVIGAGWSGLACALTLAENGLKVAVYDAAKQPGGRARRLSVNDPGLDNGQHVLLGAYRNMLDIMQRAGINSHDMLYRIPFAVTMRNAAATELDVTFPGLLPAPLNAIAGLLAARGLNMKEKFNLLGFARKIKRLRRTLDSDIPVSTLLSRNNVLPRTMRLFWEPLCLAALNTPPESASARAFLNVIHDVFSGAASNSDFLIARRDLGATFPEPVLRYIESKRGTVHMGQRVTAINIVDSTVTGVRLKSSDVLCACVVLAVPPTACSQLLAPHPQLADIHAAFDRFSYSPICTVYLRYTDTARLDKPLVGLQESTAQWIFDRRYSGQPHTMAAVISGPGAHMQLDQQVLAERVAHEVARMFPEWPAPVETRVVREKRATFLCSPGVDRFRPSHRTTVNGLWLAGDYIDRGYPATLEGAVRSGIRCAHMLLAAG